MSTDPLASGRSLAPCPTCGFYRDTPNHELGCDAAQQPTCDRCPSPMTTYDADGGYCDVHVPPDHGGLV